MPFGDTAVEAPGARGGRKLNRLGHRATARPERIRGLPNGRVADLQQLFANAAFAASLLVAVRRRDSRRRVSTQRLTEHRCGERVHG
jgi:hypothetical protein